MVSRIWMWTWIYSEPGEYETRFRPQLPKLGKKGLVRFKFAVLWALSSFVEWFLGWRVFIWSVNIVQCVVDKSKYEESQHPEIGHQQRYMWVCRINSKFINTTKNLYLSAEQRREN